MMQPTTHKSDAPKYFRTGPCIWRVDLPATLDDAARLCGIHLYTSPHRTPEGIFVLPIEYLMADLQWSKKKCQQALAKLDAIGFVRFDHATHVLLLLTALKYQIPENPNQSLAVMRRVKELPTTPLLLTFLELVKHYCYRKGAGAAAQAFATQLQEVIAQRFPQGLAKPLAEGLTEGLAERSEDALTEGSKERLRERLAEGFGKELGEPLTLHSYSYSKQKLKTLTLSRPPSGLGAAHDEEGNAVCRGEETDECVEEHAPGPDPPIRQPSAVQRRG